LIDNKYLKIFNNYLFINININGYNYIYNNIITIYQALLQKGWYLPRFCFHVKLSISGNCRMCFIELKNVNKPIIACATNISENAVIFTNSLLVFKSRESILEFILINHPIDCPICDQGGECDLQDQYTVMGSSNSRFYENLKKSVNNKNINFLIKLSLNKCINCSRCVRFSNQILGDYSFSLLGRGENLNISNYVKKFYDSEISLNVVDLCPVGASTSKLIAYDFRIWELIDVKFLDLNDSLMPFIRIDFRGLNIQRVLPLNNPDTNEEWISNYTRIEFKNVFKNRFFLPKIKNNFNFICISWNNFFILFKNMYIRLLKFFYKKKNYFLNYINIDNKKTDVYCYNYYSFFFKKFNINLLNKIFYYKSNLNRSLFFLKNKDIDFLNINYVYIYNLNFRYNFPLISYKIREKMIFDYINIYLIGSVLNLNYFFIHIGNSYLNFLQFFKKNNYKNNALILYTNLEKWILNLLHDKSLSFINLNNNNLKSIKSEVGYFKNIKLNCFKDFFSFRIDYKNVLNKNKISKSFNLLLNQKFIDFKNYNVFVPKKYNFEQNSIFINLFGVFNDFTFISYKGDHKTLKNDWNILKSIFSKFKIKNVLKLSEIKNVFVSKKWVYTFYNFLISKSMLYFDFNLINNYIKFFTKNFKNFKNLELKNNYCNLYEINKITWLF